MRPLEQSSTYPHAQISGALSLLAAGLAEIALDGDIALRSLDLQGLGPDPADRLIAATTLACRATLVTANERLLDWEHALPRHDART